MLHICSKHKMYTFSLPQRTLSNTKNDFDASLSQHTKIIYDIKHTKQSMHRGERKKKQQKLMGTINRWDAIGVCQLLKSY